jgi:hypothetical protein
MLLPRRLALWILAGAVIYSAAAVGQQAAAPEPLAVRTTALPTAFLRAQYHFRLAAAGGIAPLKWELSSGSLPKGLELTPDGGLNGSPAETGEFAFAVTVSDSARPAQQRVQNLMLKVTAPLTAEWSRYPAVNAQRIEGAIKISNATEQDFDLTLIVVAVNDIGRATALGYQHFTLKKNTTDLEVPFGDAVPAGSYEVDVDVVGEVKAINSIHRARLVTGARLQVAPPA